MPRSKIITLTCQWCGCTFHPSQRGQVGRAMKYCGRACYESAPRAKRTISIKCVCETCGGPFEVWPSTLKYGNPRFCSEACYVSYHTTHHTPLVTRFWQKVNKTKTCWLWTGFKMAWGYGGIAKDNSRPMKQLYAHRVSWEIHNGPIPAGLSVLHNCPGGDNPACVNPAHLYLGTHKDNMADMVAKGRSLKGEKCPNAKLTKAQVLKIVSAYRSGEKSKVIAKRFKIHYQSVRDIVRGKVWGHVTGIIFPPHL